MITSENYVEHAKNTDCQYTAELHARLIDKARMLHAAMGMVTEAGEFFDMLKKHIYYGKPFDGVNAKEEIGDSTWYIALAIDELRTTMNDVLTLNIDKLKLRYPNKFNSEDAINRNVEAERELLETPIYNNPEAFKDNFAKLDIKHGDGLNPIGQPKSTKDMEIIFGKSGIITPYNVSKRGRDWLLFAAKVLDHIENYTVPQYGDKGEDQVTNWSLKERLNQITKYVFRNGKNARENQDELDLIKSAHYSQLSYNKLKGDI